MFPFNEFGINIIYMSHKQAGVYSLPNNYRIGKWYNTKQYEEIR